MLGESAGDMIRSVVTEVVLLTLTAVLLTMGLGVLVLLFGYHSKKKADEEYERNKYDTRRGE